MTTTRTPGRSGCGTRRARRNWRAPAPPGRSKRRRRRLLHHAEAHGRVLAGGHGRPELHGRGPSRHRPLQRGPVGRPEGRYPADPVRRRRPDRKPRGPARRVLARQRLSRALTAGHRRAAIRAPCDAQRPHPARPRSWGACGPRRNAVRGVRFNPRRVCRGRLALSRAAFAPSACRPVSEPAPALPARLSGRRRRVWLRAPDKRDGQTCAKVGGLPRQLRSSRSPPGPCGDPQSDRHRKRFGTPARSCCREAARTGAAERGDADGAHATQGAFPDQVDNAALTARAER